MAEESRRHSLLRAIKSVHDASSDLVRILVIVNGTRRSLDLVDSLKSLPGITMHSLDTGSLPLACLYGRRLVETPYYCFLDDDDEYLPGAIDLRLQALRASPDLDLVVSNGFRCIANNDHLCFEDLNSVSSAPFESLFRENWLASCGAMFRTEKVGVDYFENPHAYLEWTWLAFRLCMECKQVGVINAPTFRIHDTPGSASKSPEYSKATFALYLRMLASNPPKQIAMVVRARIGRLLHGEADLLRSQGKIMEAWCSHLRSLTYPGGWRYLPFSRYLFSKK